MADIMATAEQSDHGLFVKKKKKKEKSILDGDGMNFFCNIMTI